MAEVQPSQRQPLQKDAAPRRYKDAPSTIAASGYVLEWCPTHPAASHGVVFQHRLAMEGQLGRFLQKEERVHHKNGDRTDNRLENLELIASHSEHMQQHWANKGSRDPDLIARVKEIALKPEIPTATLGISPTTLALIVEREGILWLHRKNWKTQILDETKVREALRGRTTVEAANLLGVHPQTLYNRYDHLLPKRASPGSLDPHKEEILRLVYRERVSKQQLADQFGVSRQCVIRSIQRWRREDAKSDEPVLQELPRLQSGPVPGRKEQNKVQPSKEQSEALAESLLAELGL